MAGSRSANPDGFESLDNDVPARSPGPTGVNDGADPNLRGETRRGDSPGPLGHHDEGEDQLAGLFPDFWTGLSEQNQNEGGRLTPVRFADRYLNTRVSVVDPDSGLARGTAVRVHIYNNAGIDRRRANMEEKDALVRRVRRELRRAGGLGLIDVESEHVTQIAHAFFGKGFPEDYAVALRHAVRYGRATLGGLQNYCDNVARLGLDCSGFVNAYFLTIQRIAEPRHISTYDRAQGRRSEGGIRDLDVLIWKHTDVAHIAVVDHVIPRSSPLRMVVVESAGSKGGLRSSEYTIVDYRNGLFKVDRGEPRRNGASESWVKFAPVL